MTTMLQPDIVVGSTHVYYRTGNKDHSDPVKLERKLRSIPKHFDCPFLLCGDFNHPKEKHLAGGVRLHQLLTRQLSLSKWRKQFEMDGSDDEEDEEAAAFDTWRRATTTETGGLRGSTCHIIRNAVDPPRKEGSGGGSSSSSSSSAADERIATDEPEDSAFIDWILLGSPHADCINVQHAEIATERRIPNLVMSDPTLAERDDNQTEVWPSDHYAVWIEVDVRRRRAGAAEGGGAMPAPPQRPEPQYRYFPDVRDRDGRGVRFAAALQRKKQHAMAVDDDQDSGREDACEEEDDDDDDDDYDAAGLFAAQTFEAHEVRLPGLPNSGIFVVDDFITADEEAGLLAFLDGGSHPWQVRPLGHRTGPHFSKQWGVRTDFTQRCFLPAEQPMPDELQPIIDRMRRVSQMKTFEPNEANSIDYRKQDGHFLAPHCDDRQLSGGILVNLSLGGDCTMRYTRDEKHLSSRGVAGSGDQYDVFLGRRSLQLQTGTARYNFQHGIPNELLHSDRRVSITFRQYISGSAKRKATSRY